MNVRLNFEHNLSVFLRMPDRNTRIKADFRRMRRSGLVNGANACLIKLVVAVLPQGTETFRLIRYPSPLGGAVCCFHRPPIFSSIYQRFTRVAGRAFLC